MYIIYDARHFEDYISGLSRYSFSVLITLIKSNKFDRLEILLNNNYDYNENELYLNLLKLINKNIILKYIDANIFNMKQNYVVSKYVNSTNCDIYFYPHFDLPLFINRKSIFVVHDLFPLVMKDYVQEKVFLKRLYFKMMIKFNLMKNNTSCICVSNNTKLDIQKYITNNYNNKLHVIYEDNLLDFGNSIQIREKIASSVKEKFLFYIGARRKHKNIKMMIDIFNILIEKKLYNGYFYIAGSEKNFELDIDNYVKDNKNIKLFGKISDSELSLIYKNMDCLFFLSEYEGFGLPIVEASKLNKKIITSNKGSCPEVLPESGLSLNIELTPDLLYKDVVEYLDNDTKIDNSKFNKKFDWNNTSNFIIDKVN